MKIVEGLALSVLAVFAPIKALIIITIVIIFADLITGILAARKKGEKISSAGLRRTVTKLCIYLTAICLGFLVEHFMIGDILPISKIIAGLISCVEFKSILENLDALNDSSIFKKLIDKLGSINDQVIKKDD
jgi:phage-related holin